MDNAAKIDNPAPDKVASVKSLGIFLYSLFKEIKNRKITNNAYETCQFKCDKPSEIESRLQESC